MISVQAIVYQLGQPPELILFRLNTEIAVSKKTLEEATRQVKEIAVKVIESGTKPQQNLTNDP